MEEAAKAACRKCGGSLPAEAPFCPWCGTRQEPERKKRSRGNGEGTVYQLPGGKYRADMSLFVQGRRFRATRGGFARKKDALAAMPELKAELERKVALANGYDQPEEPEDPRLEKLLREWQESYGYQKLSETKKSHYRTAWERMRSTWGLRIGTLRLSTMQRVVEECPGGYYPKRDIKALYSHLYKYAIRHEVVERNRALYLELPECKGGRREVWKPEEIAAWWRDSQAGHRVSRLVLIMIYTGMRTGELRAQDPAKVYLDKRYMVGGIKTQAGKDRQIPLAQVILPLVRQALKEARYGLLPMRPDEFYDEYAAAVERLGIRPLSPYSCRHTAATALAEAGVAPAVIQEILGHADYSTTLGYTHISAEKKLEAVEALVQREKESAEGSSMV